MTDRITVGRRGEREAERYLRRSGYRIIERNYRTRRGEIDRITEEGETIVFVEVRFRSSDRYGSPSETVDRRKRRRLILAAAHYLAGRGLTDRPCRFDILSLSPDGAGGMKLEHLVNAFDRNGRPTGTWSGPG